MTDPEQKYVENDEAAAEPKLELDDETVEDLTPPEDDEVQGGPTTPGRNNCYCGSM